MADQDLERYFSQSEKQLEIDRVLQCFKLDPFSILDLPYEKPDSKTLKLQYRRKSLMIHPDKVKHDRAEEAFALLKKAELELEDEARVKHLLSIVEEAKVEVLRDNGYKVKTQVVATSLNSDVQGSSDAAEENKADKPNSERSKVVIESATSVNTEQYPFLRTREGRDAVRAKVKEILFEMELRRRRQVKKEMEAEGKSFIQGYMAYTYH